MDSGTTQPRADQSFLNISIKDEPLDINDLETEPIFNDYGVKNEEEDLEVTDFKEETDEASANEKADGHTIKNTGDDQDEGLVEFDLNKSISKRHSPEDESLNNPDDEGSIINGTSEQSNPDDAPVELDLNASVRESDSPDNQALNSPESEALNINGTSEKSEVVCALETTPQNADKSPNSEGMVTKMITINGKTKTCILVIDPGLKQSIIECVEKARKPSSPIRQPSSSIFKDVLTQTPKESPVRSVKETESSKSSDAKWDSPIVQCSRCSSEVHLDKFRQHIDSCPPRKIVVKKRGDGASKCRKKTVRAMYNPISGEIETLNKNEKVTNSSSKPNKIVRSVQPPNSLLLNNGPVNTRCDKTLQSSVARVECSVIESNSRITPSGSVSQPTSQQSVANRLASTPNICNSKTNPKGNSDQIGDKPMPLKCDKCNFQSLTLLVLEAHRKKHLQSLSETVSVNASKISADASPSIKIVNIHSLTDKNLATNATPTVASSINESSPTRKNEKRADSSKTGEEVRSQSPLKSPRQRSKSMSSLKSLKKIIQETNFVSRTKSDETLYEVVTEFRGFDEAIVEAASKTSSVDQLKKLVQSWQRLQTNAIDTDNATLKKNVHSEKQTEQIKEELLHYACENNQEEDPLRIQDEVAPSSPMNETVPDLVEPIELDGPRRSMRIRSKSFSANKFDSFVRGRSRSVGRDKSKTDASKRSKSVPRMCLESDDIRNSREDDEDLGDSGNDSSKQTSSSRVRSKSFVESNGIHPLTYYQNFLKSRSKSVERSKLKSLLAETIVNSDDEKTDKQKDNLVEISGVSNTGSVVDNCIGIDNDKDPSDDFSLLTDSTFSCSICSFTTDKKRILTDHQRNHRRSKNPIFQCVYCNQRYTRYMLYLHVQNVHPGQKFQINENSKSLVPARVEKTSNSVQKIPATSSFAVGASDELIRSIKTTNKSGRLSYNCEKCSYQCSYMPNIIRHIESHKNNEPIEKCSKCNYSSTPNALRYHTRICEGKESNPLVGKGEVNLKGSTGLDDTIDQFEPTKSHNVDGETVYHCKSCSYVSQNAGGMTKHINTHKISQPIVKCPKCDYKSTPRATQKHSKHCSGPAHKKNPSFVKTLQGKPRSTPKTAKLQSKFIREPEGLAPAKMKSKTKFRCSKCVYSTSLRIKLKIHLRKHHQKPDSRDDGPLKCKLCSFVTTRSSKLAQHQKTHKQNLPILKCPHCNFKSVSTDLNAHVLTCKPIEKNPVTNKSKRKSYQCKLCPFKTHKPSTYGGHMAKHKEKVYIKCNLCSVTYDRQGWLDKHMESHLNNEPIEKCPHCEFRSTPTPLRGHIQRFVHSSLKTSGADGTTKNSDDKKSTFQCDLCSFSTFLRIKLKFHMKKYHQVSNKTHFTMLGHCYQCVYCSYRNSTLPTVKKHLRTHTLFKMPVENCHKCYDYKSTKPYLEKHMRMCRGNELNSLESSIVEGSPIKTKLNHTLQNTSTNKAGHGSNTEKSDDSGRNLACPLCSFHSLYKQSLKHHIEIRHLDQLLLQNEFDKIYKCEKCTLTSLFRGKLKSHKAETGHTFKLVGIDQNKSSNADSDTTKKVRSTLDRGKHSSQDSSSNLNINMNSSRNRTENNTTEIAHKENSPFNIRRSFRKSSYSRKYHVNDIPSSSSSTKSVVQSSTDENCFPIATGGYGCRSCSYTARYHLDIIRHQKAHENESFSIMQCPKCSYKSTPIALRYHMRKCDEHNNTNAACSSETSQEDGTEDHMTNRKSKPTISKEDTTESLQCSKCSFSSRWPLELKKHQLESHSNVEMNEMSDQEMFNCSLCSFSSRWHHSTKRHISRHTRLNSEIIKCDWCDFESTPVVVRSHKKTCKDISDIHSPPRKRMRRSKSVLGTNWSSELSVVENEKAANSASGIDARLNNSDEIANISRTSVVHGRKNDTQVSLSPPTNETPDQQVYKCSRCSFSSRWPSSTKRHMSGHTDLISEIRKCDRCDFESTPMVLRFHKKACSAKSDNSDTPILRHTKRKRSKSVSGNSKASEMSLLESEVANAVLESGVDGQLDNSIVGMQTSQDVREELANEVTNSPQKSVVDGVNTKTFNETMRPRPNGTPQEMYKCHMCSFSSRWSTSTKRHISRHTGLNAEIKKCDWCDFESIPMVVSLHRKICIAKLENKNASLDPSSEGMDPSKSLSENNEASEVSLIGSEEVANAHLESGNDARLDNSIVGMETSEDAREDPANEDMNSSQMSVVDEQNTNTSRSLISQPDQKMYECPLCSFSSRWPGSTKRHMHSHRWSKSDFKKCDWCEFESTPMVVGFHKKSCIAISENKSSPIGPPSEGKGRSKSAAGSEVASESTLVRSKDDTHADLDSSVDAILIERLETSEDDRVDLANEDTNSPQTTVVAGQNTSTFSSLSSQSNGTPVLEFESTPMVVGFHKKSCIAISENKSSPIGPPSEGKERSKSDAGSDGASETPLVGRDEAPNADRNSRVDTRLDSSVLGEKTSEDSLGNLVNDIVDKSQTSLVDGHNGHMSSNSVLNSNINTPFLMLDHRKNYIATSDQDMFKCSLCSFSSGCYHSIKCHMSSHNGLKSDIKKCDSCDFESTPIRLSMHKKTCIAKSVYGSTPIGPPKTGMTKSNLSSHAASDLNLVGRDEISKADFEPSVDAALNNAIVGEDTSEFVRVDLANEVTPNSRKRKRQPKDCSLLNSSTTTKSAHSNAGEKTSEVVQEDLANEVTMNVETNGRPNQKMFKCPLCSYRSRRYFSAKRHMSSHTGPNSDIKKCDWCDFESTTYALLDHRNTCPAVSETNGVSQSPPKSIISCPNCLFFTDLRIKLKFHMKKCHPPRIDGIKCKYCSLVCPLPSMKRHLISHTSNKPIIKCKECDFRSTPRALKQHRSRHLSEKRHPARIKCKYCSFVCPPAYMHKHLITHNRKMPINKCTECDFKSTPRALKQHRSKHFLGKGNPARMKCKYCSFVCTPAYMHKHLITHNRKRPIIKCTECDFKSTPRALKGHRSKHFFEKGNPARIESKYCSFVSPPASMNKHLMSHDSERPVIQCSKCDFKSTQFLVKQHMLSHSVDKSQQQGNRKVKCKHCSLVCSITSMKKHLTSHTRKRPTFQCTKCDFKSTRSDLDKHMLTHSADEEVT